ncbi:type VII secretion integral membrane protein EccD [Mycolicibacterium agri]|nr:type VII secretion integral membrane protein EccD [Mycolicibacterium agri]
MASGLCRVTVHTDHGEGAEAVDLALPTRRELGELLPSIVDLTGCREARFDDRWVLSRPDGTVLDESITLQENGVRDGDVLLLTAEAVAMTVQQHDSWHSVADAIPVTDRGWLRRAGAGACLWSAGVGAVALGWPAGAPPGSRAVVASAVTLLATVASVVASRVDPDPLPTVTLGLTATVFAAVAGFLMVPNGPAPPNFVLAAAVCAATATVVLHVTGQGTTEFIAVIAFMGTMAVVAVAAVFWPASLAAAGAALTAVSLALSGVAARLSIALAGLAPRMPTPQMLTDDGSLDDDAVDDVRAGRAHCTLTGLLVGFSAATAAGVVAVAADRHEPAISAILFAVAMSAVLLLRARQQLGAVRPTALVASGLVCATAVLAQAVLSAPRHAGSLSLAAVVLGGGALYLARADLDSRLSPVARRAVDVVEYVALAAVVPLACWVAGVFGLVRGLSLP